MQLINQSNEQDRDRNLERFLELIEEIYSGSLKAFSDDFSYNDPSFYERLKKDIQRARKGNLSAKKSDLLKKYIFFLEYKLWEKKKADQALKRLDIKIDSAIKALCKTHGKP
ncbi:hypothetical protein [Acinetobacter indicus]|uniref:hypothetical protein n=1 Tax=Acinetobacter indicus TaxID=756892 RepID=UPI000948B408|nr:hypothetical protein [Acinetobacter indicus]MCO8087996.1 hypothetical protein [Acinetobacter indicus]MDM1269931.1 hypothetical protein [Acinetobacter indicus]